MIQFPKWLQWTTRGSKSQAGNHVVVERPRWGSKSHKERQMDGHITRPKVAGPQQRATWQVRD